MSQRHVSLSRQRPVVERRVFLNDNNTTKTLKQSGKGIETPPIRSIGRGVSPIPDPGTRKDNTQNLDIEQQALGMSKAERQQLLDRLSLSLQSENEATRDSTMWCASVVKALQARLGAGGASAYGPALAKSIVGAVKPFAPIAEFILDVGLDAFHVVERQAALNFLAEMVVADAASFTSHVGMPLTLKIVAQRAAHVRAIFDRAFPSYLSAGLGKIIFRQMASRGQWDGDRGIAS
jgi:hypothetical protein